MGNEPVSTSPSTLASVELTVFNSGWVKGPKRIVLPGNGGGVLDMPALFAMIRHPSLGITLYDTGYSTRFYQATSRFPYRIMRYLTPARVEERDNADQQLARAGVQPGQVEVIVLGHGHADHVPGVAYFPRARVVVDRREWDAMQGPALKVMRKAYLKSLYRDLTNPVEPVDFEISGKPLGPFERTVDLCGDGSMILVSLPGHSRGQMGLIVRLPAGKEFFFIGDTGWVRENYLQMRPPASIVSAIWSSRADMMESMRQVRDYAAQNPETVVVPSHCPTAWERLRQLGVASCGPSA